MKKSWKGCGDVFLYLKGQTVDGFTYCEGKLTTLNCVQLFGKLFDGGGNRYLHSAAVIKTSADALVHFKAPAVALMKNDLTFYLTTKTAQWQELLQYTVTLLLSITAWMFSPFIRCFHPGRWAGIFPYSIQLRMVFG